MDLESILIIVCRLLFCIGIPWLIVRHRKKKKKKEELRLKAAEEAEAKRKAAEIGKKYAEEHLKKLVEERAKTEAPDAVSRVKSDPAEESEARHKAADTLKKYAEERLKKLASEKPDAVSQVKSDPAFTAGGSLSGGRPAEPSKPAITQKQTPPKGSASTQPAGEVDVLLQAETRKSVCWVCPHCSAENQQRAERCTVCGKLK